MFRTYLFYIAFVFSLVCTALLLPFWYVLSWFGLKGAQRRYGYHVSRNWARFLLAAAGIRVRVKGMEHIPQNDTVVFVSNHQGNFDIPVLFSHLPKPIGFLAKKELAKVPVLNAWMPKLGCVFIDRTDMRQSVKAIHECSEGIKDGQSMVVFPEGTRSKGPQTGVFKKGSLRLVEKTGVPIVPITINGTYRAMEARTGRIGPADVTVTVSPPIYYNQLSKEERDNINSLVRDEINRNL